MHGENYSEMEAADAKRVDRAAELLNGRKLADAFKILSDVLSRTPATYVRELQFGDARHIKFWDLKEFTHFVTERWWRFLA